MTPVQYPKTVTLTMRKPRCHLTQLPGVAAVSLPGAMMITVWRPHLIDLVYMIVIALSSRSREFSRVTLHNVPESIFGCQPP
jgi:hypothetical protein